jgi:multidrug transporter EmrE-like cation transporter
MSGSPETIHISPTEPPPRSWHTRPYVQLAISILFSAAAQPLLKAGADAVRHKMEAVAAPSWQTPLYFLLNGWAWLGIAAIISSLLGWLYALRTVPLNIAFNLAGITQVLVPLVCWIILGEQISPLRWAGILCVTLGVAVTAKEAVRLEEKL